MKNENRFEILAARARSETPAAVDVADRVIAALGAERDRMERMAERPLMWLAAVSSAVAVPVVVAAFAVYDALIYPLFEISQAIEWVVR